MQLLLRISLLALAVLLGMGLVAVRAQDVPQDAQDADDEAALRTRIPGDSTPVFTVSVLRIEGNPMSKAERKTFYRSLTTQERLAHNVRMLYPIACDAAFTAKKIDRELTAIGKRHDQKLYVHRLEKELFKKHEARLRQLSINQGRILIKLIDRQSGNTAFQLIKEYKSGTTAVFWQLVARMFGSSLKYRYDPAQETEIEPIVQRIERGEDPLYYGYLLQYQQSLQTQQ